MKVIDKTWGQCATSKNAYLREAAMTGNTPLYILAIGARDKSKWVRRAAMKNPKCDEKILKIGARDTDLTVRRLVAIHQNVTAKILATMVETTGDVVLKNPKCDEKVLLLGAKSKNKRLRILAMSHPNATTDVLIMSMYDRYIIVRKAAVMNPNCPVGILMMLATKNSSVQVRVFIAAYTDDQNILEILLRDKSKRVRDEVTKNQKFDWSHWKKDNADVTASNKYWNKPAKK